MIYFAFVYPLLLYGIEVYANTPAVHLATLRTLNNKLLRILQQKQQPRPQGVWGRVIPRWNQLAERKKMHFTERV